MKRIVLVLSIMVTGLVFGQAGETQVTSSAVFGSSSNSVGLFQGEEGSLLINVNDIQKIEGVASIRDFDSWRLSSEVTDGSVYLYDSWSSKGYVYAGEKTYVFPKMNFHVAEGAVVSKFQQDSIFTFGTTGYDKIVFNNTVFKSIYTPARGGNVMYEVVFESPEYSILKSYSIEIKESSPNPMVNRSRRKIVKNSHYVKMEGSKFTKFKLKKKNILELADSHSETIAAYVKSNGLSYKDDQDVSQILIYLYGLQH